MLEHGAYNLLLDRYYSTEQGIPADQAHRVARARTKEEKAAVDVVLQEFFTLDDGVWIKGRVEDEIERFRALEPERQAKKENVNERKRRSRERRAQLFDFLRDHDIVPDFDTPIRELQSLVDGVKSKIGHAPVTRDMPVTSKVVTRDVTATQTPDTRHQTPEPISSSVVAAGFNSPISAGARSAAAANGRFQLPLDWRPSPDFPGLLRFAGVPPDYPWEDDLPEFVLYRRAAGEQFNQGIWEKKFIDTVKRNQAKRLQAGNEPTRIPGNWRLDGQCNRALILEGIPQDFIDASQVQFVAFWLEDGSAVRSWNAKFIEFVRTRWATTAALPAAQGAFDALTDRSWATGLVAEEPDYETDIPLLGAGAH